MYGDSTSEIPVTEALYNEEEELNKGPSLGFILGTLLSNVGIAILRQTKIYW